MRLGTLRFVGDSRCLTLDAPSRGLCASSRQLADHAQGLQRDQNRGPESKFTAGGQAPARAALHPSTPAAAYDGSVRTDAQRVQPCLERLTPVPMMSSERLGRSPLLSLGGNNLVCHPHARLVCPGGFGHRGFFGAAYTYSRAGLADERAGRRGGGAACRRGSYHQESRAIRARRFCTAQMRIDLFRL